MGEWYYSLKHGQLCQVTKTQILWGSVQAAWGMHE